MAQNTFGHEKWPVKFSKPSKITNGMVQMFKTFHYQFSMVKPQDLVVLQGANANGWPFIQLYDEFVRGSIPMDMEILSLKRLE